jgi:adenylate cyclase
MFADLSGFTALSQRLPPDALLDATNAYLAIMADEVEAGGGYVDKFIGDAAMAIWNAPHRDTQHALHAVATGQRILARVAAHAAAEAAAGRPAMTVKIAIHSGEAVVGNVGSRNRLNYTAVGETVNVAARLERAGEPYGAPIVVSEATARLVMPSMQLRRLGEARLRGIHLPVGLYAP